MTSTTTSAAAIEQAITTVFGEYVNNPLLYLREANIQFRLLQAIKETLIGDDCAHASVIDRKRGTEVGQGRVGRVQAELKPGGGNTCVADLVVLRTATEESPVKLLREKNGALDIVAEVDPNDLDAVIEIKAACSADPMQRLLFRKDLNKLSEIGKKRMSATPVQLHFVLIDKSVALGKIETVANKPAVDTWWKQERLGTKNANLVSETYSFDASGEKPASERFIHIWTLAKSDGDPAAQLQHLYAPF